MRLVRLPPPSLAAHRGEKRSQRGQSLVELGVTLPVLLLLFSGLLDVGRAYYFQVEASDASRDVARVAAAYSLGPTGQASVPGDAAICDEARADLSNVASVTCQFSTAPPPFATPSTIAPGSAVVIVYPATGSACSKASFCRDPADPPPSPPLRGTVTATVYYNFSLITPAVQQLASGGRILMEDQAQMVSAW